MGFSLDPLLFVLADIEGCKEFYGNGQLAGNRCIPVELQKAPATNDLIDSLLADYKKPDSSIYSRHMVSIEMVSIEIDKINKFRSNKALFIKIWKTWLLKYC